MSSSTLTTALDHLRLEGAIFLRGEYTEAWSYESPTGEMMASVLRPGREASSTGQEPSYTSAMRSSVSIRVGRVVR
jgi:hypothetical protein